LAFWSGWTVKVVAHRGSRYIQTKRGGVQFESIEIIGRNIAWKVVLRWFDAVERHVRGEIDEVEQIELWTLFACQIIAI
jgi:hypothetical protein